jgi:hypothetical protein
LDSPKFKTSVIAFCFATPAKKDGQSASVTPTHVANFYPPLFAKEREQNETKAFSFLGECGRKYFGESW